MQKTITMPLELANVLRWDSQVPLSALSTAAPSPEASDDGFSDGARGTRSDSRSDTELVVDPSTVIIRKMAKTSCRADVQARLNSDGFAGQFDFLYVPLDYCSKLAFGHAVVNFTNTASAMRFYSQQLPAGWPLGLEAGTQPEVVLAAGQDRHGRDACVERYRNSPVMHRIVPDEFKPVVLSRGRRVAFPRPTERLSAPEKLPRSVWRQWTESKRQRQGPDASGIEKNTHQLRGARVASTQDRLRQDSAPSSTTAAELRELPTPLAGPLEARISQLALHKAALESQLHQLQQAQALAQLPGFRPPPGLQLPSAPPPAHQAMPPVPTQHELLAVAPKCRMPACVQPR